MELDGKELDGAELGIELLFSVVDGIELGSTELGSEVDGFEDGFELTFLGCGLIFFLS